MDQEIDFRELWNRINESVDWLLASLIGLLVLNALFGSYLIWAVMFQADFYKKYDIGPSDKYESINKNLAEPTSMEEIDVEPPSTGGALPPRYDQLKTTSLFVPLGGRVSQVAQSDTVTEDKQKKLPKIQGYTIIGRITGQGDDQAGMLKRIDDGKTFVVREGEYLENTDIKVKNVTDTVVQLSQPEHRPTSFQFKTDQIKERIRRQIKFQ